MLLPLPPVVVRNRSLKFHACFATVRKGFGSAEHLAELASVMYIAWFLQHAGYGDLSLAQFRDAEQYMECANQRGAETGTWFLDDEGYPFFERILLLHDRQLADAPAYAIVTAEDQLLRFIASDAPSPLPPPAPDHLFAGTPVRCSRPPSGGNP